MCWWNGRLVLILVRMTWVTKLWDNTCIVNFFLHISSIYFFFFFCTEGCKLLTFFSSSSPLPVHVRPPLWLTCQILLGKAGLFYLSACNTWQISEGKKPTTNSATQDWTKCKFHKSKDWWVLHTFTQTSVNKGFVAKSFKFIPDLIFKVKQNSSIFYMKGSWICCCC